MSNEYGSDVDTGVVVEDNAVADMAKISDTNGDSVLEVMDNKEDDSWKYKLKEIDIVPKEANRESFKAFNRLFSCMGDLPTPEQEEILKPILATINGKGFTLRTKDLSFVEEFYTWASTIFSRAEHYLSYKKKGITFKPTLTEVSNDAIAIALEAKKRRFKNTDLEKFKGWQDIAKQMLGLNAHIALGADLETPLSFIILNTPGGEEPGDRIDFDTMGFNVDVLLLAERYNIPTFNINKPGGIKRLEDFVATF